MAALTQDRRTAFRSTVFYRKVQRLIVQDKNFFDGGLVMLGQDDGLVKPLTGSASAQTVTVVGVAQDHFFGANNVVPYTLSQMEIATGIVGLDMGTGGNLLTAKNAGVLVFGSDDHTVNKTSNAGQWPLVGRLEDVEGAVAWVLVDPTLIPSGSSF